MTLPSSNPTPAPPEGAGPSSTVHVLVLTGNEWALVSGAIERDAKNLRSLAVSLAPESNTIRLARALEALAPKIRKHADAAVRAEVREAELARARTAEVRERILSVPPIGKPPAGAP